MLKITKDYYGTVTSNTLIPNFFSYSVIKKKKTDDR